MKNLGLSLLMMWLTILSNAQIEIPDLYEQNQTYDHNSLILKYISLEKKYPGKCKLITYGASDCGRPLHLFVMNDDGEFLAEKLDRKDKSVFLINNGIHPGEPCGIDGSLKLSRDLLANDKLPKNVVIAIIPMYNIGGGTNRSCCSRANQNGPEEYGFRGNARNLDLNRDFIKLDSKNAHEFVKIFQEWDPNVFVDTHTSNGADYQHVMTLITTQLNKLHPSLANYTREHFNPYLFSNMEKDNYPMVPYMNLAGKTPKDGIVDYLETPRYSTGYAAQFDCIGFVSEAHMLKPYKDRVKSTILLLQHMLNFMSTNNANLIQAREETRKAKKQLTSLAINYVLDTTKHALIDFNGFEAAYKKSDVSGLDRLYYDRKKPYSTKIKYFNHYTATDSINIPKAYIIPQAWREVISRLKVNGVPMSQIKQDTTITVQSSYIEDYQTVKSPYEGHYLHYITSTRYEEQSLQFYRGDYIVNLGTDKHDQFIIEALEARSVDSYFNWNFFDEILMQKEWFSSYVFEDKAAEILRNNPDLQRKLDDKRVRYPEFASDARAQLAFVYYNSEFYESSHMRYPVYRIVK